VVVVARTVMSLLTGSATEEVELLALVVGAGTGEGAASGLPQLVAISSTINPLPATAGIHIAFRETTLRSVRAMTRRS
jgi:hypothetical protein